jgi:hypothetical protein
MIRFNCKSLAKTLLHFALAAALVACGGGTTGDPQAQVEADSAMASALAVHRTAASGKTGFAVTVSAGGTVSSKPVGISCSSASTTGCTSTFYQGAIVTLNPTPVSGYKFSSWSGACSGSSSCAVTVGTSAIAVSARFVKKGSAAPTTTILTVTTSSGGTVNSNPAGIACVSGTTAGCSSAFTSGTVVTMTATPASGYTFSGWSGACTGTSNCALTVGTTALAVAAKFTASAAGGTPGSPGTSGAQAVLPGYQIGYSSCPAPAAGGKTYTIGLLDSASQPSGPQTIAAFTGWNTLAAGDVVCIYGKSSAYAERLVLTRSGSDSAHPIRIVGVVQKGFEPVLTGKNATTAAAFNYGANIAQNYEGGEVSITGLDYGVPVSYLNVEGLTIQGATTAEVGGTATHPTYSVNSFSDPSINNNAPAAWSCGSAGVNIIRADHVSLIHDRIKDNDNGIFVNSNNGNTSSNILVAYSHIYGNGVFGEEQGAWNPGHCDRDAHGVYSEAKNIAFVGNRFGGPRQGAATNLLKDRSSGLSISNNLFQPDGVLETALGDGVLVGAVAQPLGHILDLVESYDSSVGFYSLGSAYLNVSVFGNTFFDDSAGANANQGTTVPLHFGGDQGNAAYYRTKLHFYNNTVISRRDSSSSDGTFSWFELETGTNAEAWNNIFYASANKTQTASVFRLLDTYCYSSPSACGTLSYAAQNWISPVFGTNGVNGTATDPSFVSLATNDVHLGANNATIVGNGQTGNPAYPATATTLPLQYVDFLGSTARPFSATKIDLGAFGYKP